ncbi:zinc finger protein 32-like [Periophthalmus magnuspinnatus]|uniref:zinc finger protein 32-like n=1 Tax=Periophthalmus magnuspinnatus TaxID=409849 RepID=UPI00243717B8|nr:zinc finger protein 32-like [Periophthalmus magnuspinnatus]
MSKGQTLRALVNERLTAAAEEIFALFERTIAEYEEELCRSKEENQRKQELLDSVLNQCTRQTQTWIKEEPEDTLRAQLPVGVQESSAVCVKTEESSLLQHRQTEHREETQGEDISTEPHLHSETEGHMEHSSDTENDEDWRAPISCSAAQMETEADGDHCNQVQIRATAAPNSCLSHKYKSAPETSATVNYGDMSGTAQGAEGKKYECPMCQKRFGTMQKLQRHIRVHTGEKPFSCLICQKTFSQKYNLDVHIRLHTGERPYSCSICMQTFAQKNTLNIHRKKHTGERPYSCSICEKSFSQKCNLDAHVRTHTGQRPYRCSMCEKTFSEKNNLSKHVRTHTGERPYSCCICYEGFSQKIHLKRHMRTHRTETD